MSTIVKETKRTTKSRYCGCGPCMEEVITSIFVIKGNERKWYTLCSFSGDYAFYISNISIFDIYSKDSEDISNEEVEYAEQFLYDIGYDYEESSGSIEEFTQHVQSIEDRVIRNALLTLIDLQCIEISSLYDNNKYEINENELIGRVLG